MEGISGAGGYVGVRIHEHSILLCLGRGSSNMTDVKAVLFGMNWYTENGFTCIILECDSLIVIDMLQERVIQHCRCRIPLEKLSRAM